MYKLHINRGDEVALCGVSREEINSQPNHRVYILRPNSFTKWPLKKDKEYICPECVNHPNYIMVLLAGLE